MGLMKFTDTPIAHSIFNPDYERLTETGVVPKDERGAEIISRLSMDHK